MAKATNPIPQGYHTITPSLTCRDAAKAIDFYKKAFGAQELMRMPSPDGSKVSHAEIKIGDSVVFVSDEFPGMSAAPAPTTTPSYSLFLYVEDVDNGLQSGRLRRRPRRHADAGHVLGRSLRQGHRSLRPSMGTRHAHRRRCAGRDRAPRSGILRESCGTE